MNALTINFNSIEFNKDIIKPNEKIKITVTTFPGQFRRTIIFDPKINNNSIILKSKDEFRMLIFIFEKKNIFQFNPLIASRAVDATSFLKNNEQKSFNIYKQIHSQNEESKTFTKIVGKMTVELNRNCSYNISKIHKGNGYSTLNNEGENGNKLLFQEDELIN